MKLPKLTQKIASIFRELTRTGTARGPGAVGQNSDSMGPPETLVNDRPSSPSGVLRPSTPCDDAAIQGYYACGAEDAKRITQQDASNWYWITSSNGWAMAIRKPESVITLNTQPK